MLNLCVIKKVNILVLFNAQKAILSLCNSVIPLCSSVKQLKNYYTEFHKEKESFTEKILTSYSFLV